PPLDSSAQSALIVIALGLVGYQRPRVGVLEARSQLGAVTAGADPASGGATSVGARCPPEATVRRRPPPREVRGETDVALPGLDDQQRRSSPEVTKSPTSLTQRRCTPASSARTRRE